MSEFVTPTANPAELIITENVRKDARLTASFISSIRSRGVLQPVVVVESADGLEVIDGQRRTLAAIEAGLSEIPIHVVSAPEEASWRIATQVVANEHREDLTAAEEARAYADLALFGIAAGTISKKLNLPKSRVEKGLAIAAAGGTLSRIESLPVSLDEAAVFAEFSDDEAVLDELAEGVKTGQFAHVASRARIARLKAAAVEEAVAPLRAAGVTILPDFPGYGAGHLRLGDHYRAYLTPAGEPLPPDLDAALEVVPASHRGAYVFANYHTLNEAIEVSVVHYLLDWQANGYTEARLGRIAPVVDEEERAAQERAAQERASRERAESELWVAAVEPRHAFIASLLEARQLPAGVTQFAVVALTGAMGIFDPYDLDRAPVRERALAFLDIVIPEAAEDDDSASEYDLVQAALVESARRRPEQTLAALILAGHEEYAALRHAWMSGSPGAYLSALSSWGYVLSDVEQRAVAAAESVSE